MSLRPLFARVKKIVSNKIFFLAKIRNNIDRSCAISIYEQIILPLLDYAGFMLISGNKSDRSDLQTLQNNALRICFIVRLRDMVSIERMHNMSKHLSLEQRRKKQLLCLMFIFTGRHDNIQRVHGHNTRAAQIYSFTHERYHNVKYKNSPYYKGTILWDELPVHTRQCNTLLDFKKSLNRLYRKFDDSID